MRSILLGASLALVLAIPAVAQTNSATQNSNSSTTGSVSSQSQNTSTPVQQQVQQNRSKAGFTDIKIMPESFLVRAKDPGGNPIMMVINPDSVTAVTYGANSTTNSNRTANPNSAQSNRSNR